MKIYLKQKPKDIADLIYHMVIEGEKTFSNKKKTKTQCGKFCNRSIKDIRIAARTYFKEKEVKKLKNILNLLDSNSKIAIFRCKDIKRKVIAMKQIYLKEDEYNNIINGTDTENNPGDQHN